MENHSLRMTTAIAACLSLVAPAPLMAQEAAQSFPCVAPDGVEAADANALSVALLDYLNADAVSEDFGNCDTDAVQSAFEAGGDALASAFANAPAEVQGQLIAVNPDLAMASEAAPVAEPEPEVAAEAEVEPVVEDTAQVVPEAVEEAPAETAEASTAPSAVEEAPVQADAQEVVPETTEPETDIAAETAVPEADTTQEVTTDAEPAAPAAEEETALTGNDVEIAAEESPVAPQASEAEQTDVVAAPSGAGEAGGEQLTDEERQALIQERENDAVDAAPAAAAIASDETAVVDEQEAEVETQTITETDVRRSSEDYATAVVGNAQAATSDSNRGASNFEKALLLGLGAVVVGAVLNNGDQVVSNSGDRVVIERDGELRVLKNDDELLRRPGTQEQTQTFQDGSTRTILTYEDGSQIITIRANDGAVLRRTLIQVEDGTEVVLFDDTQAVEPIAFDELPILSTQLPAQAVDTSDQDALRVALERVLAVDAGRQFSLQQIRDFKRVRSFAPQVELDQVTFASGSAAIQPEQAEALRALGLSMINIIIDNPRAIFLVEGHTDAVGNAGYNLALSDRRAETVALALTEYFGVPPQNLITQGYGETDLKVPVLTDERANRRASIRNITQLLSRS